MKLNDVRRKMKNYPYVEKAFFYSQGKTQKTIKNQLIKWVKKGEIVRLRRGLYTLPESERSCGLSKPFIANVLYYPSYVSLEYALSYWGMIPEAVFVVTSITPKKTQRFLNPLGEFDYKNLKKELFFGFVSIKDEHGFDVLVATPEKALLDFLYLRAPSKLKGKSYFEESLRLQNVEQLDIKKLQKMAKKMKSLKVLRIVQTFMKYKDEL